MRLSVPVDLFLKQTPAPAQKVRGKTYQLSSTWWFELVTVV